MLLLAFLVGLSLVGVLGIGLRATAEQETAPETTGPEDSPWLVLDVNGPKTAGVGETVTLTVTVYHVGGAVANGLQLSLREGEEPGWVAGPPATVAALAPGHQTAVALSGRVVGPPGRRLRVGVELRGENLAEPLHGLYTVLVRQDEAEEWRP